MFTENKRESLVEDKTLKNTVVTFNYSEIEVLIETLSFAKNIYANSAKSKRQSDSDEDRSIAYNHEYASLLIEELMDKIIKEGRLAEHGGVIQ